MTLQEWSEDSGYDIGQAAGGTYVTLDSDCDSGVRASLFHLSDYAVSTVSGPVVWLVPR